MIVLATSVTSMASSANPLLKTPTSGIKLDTNIEFLLGGVKVYQASGIAETTPNSPERLAVAFQFDVPLQEVKPGNCICLVNIVDQAGGTYCFPRRALRFTGSTASPAVAAQRCIR